MSSTRVWVRLFSGSIEVRKVDYTVSDCDREMCVCFASATAGYVFDTAVVTNEADTHELHREYVLPDGLSCHIWANTPLQLIIRGSEFQALRASAMQADMDCPDCFGTGLFHGWQTPCPRGCTS